MGGCFKMTDNRVYTKETDGISLNEQGDHWMGECPTCGFEHEFEGYFDPEDDIKCRCKTIFRIKRIWIDNETFV